MKELPIKKYVRYLFGIAILVFVLNKLYVRPLILENDLPGLFQIITFSIPNLIEAIIGTLILTGITLQIKEYFNKKLGNIKDTYVHLSAVGICTFYVISQELKFHNFGGNNVYDPYDVIASVIGLTMTFGIIQIFGFSDKTETLKMEQEK